MSPFRKYLPCRAGVTAVNRVGHTAPLIMRGGFTTGAHAPLSRSARSVGSLPSSIQR
jgi:hypothetical protein